MVEISNDTFFNGKLRVAQSIKGYRFSVDAVLLAAAVRPMTGDRIIDLGTGCGIVPLILATRHPNIEITAVEIQEELALIAQQNVTDNGYDTSIQVRNIDLRRLPDRETAGEFDWVVSNPPFRRPGTGRINPNRQKALARFEIEIDLAQLLSAAARLLRRGGRFMVIYLAERSVDLIVQMRQSEIEPTSIQPVQSYHGEAAKLVLVEGVKNGRGGSRIEPPIVVYKRDGSFTDVIEEMMRP